MPGPYKETIKSLLPPAAVELARALLKRSITYSGDYPDFQSASARASGYDTALILERVKEASLKVKQGAGAFERDSVLFDKVHHSFPVLAGLLRAGLESGGRLSVLDFGGALGSSYYQCRDFLAPLSLRWSIVEQPHFVRCGHELFADQRLQFYFTIADCVRQAAPNAALLSGVLQFLPEPYAALEDLADSIGHVVIDRTAFSDADTDRYTVQHVPASIYSASYALRIFAKQPFLDRVRARYEVLADFDGADGTARCGRLQFNYGGLILRRR